MTRMIKAPGGTKDKYQNFKHKFNTVKVENQETINRIKHLEGNLNKNPSAPKIESRNKAIKVTKSERQPPKKVIKEIP